MVDLSTLATAGIGITLVAGLLWLAVWSFIEDARADLYQQAERDAAGDEEFAANVRRFLGTREERV